MRFFKRTRFQNVKFLILFSLNFLACLYGSSSYAQNSKHSHTEISFTVGEFYYDRLAIENTISSFLGAPSQTSGSSASSFYDSVTLSHGTEVQIVELSKNVGVGLVASVFNSAFV